MIKRMRQAALLCLTLVLAGIGSVSCSAGSAAGVVTVLGPWTGSEEDSFRAVFEKFEHDTGIDVRYEGTRDLGALLATRFQEKNPPDVVVLPSPGELDDLSERGRLVPLGTVLEQSWTTRMTEQYGPAWLRLGQYNREQKAVVFKVTLKGLVWYSPEAFPSAGHEPPANWDELVELSTRIDRAKSSVWCLGLESSSTSGWPGSDWLEDIVLHQAGPDTYQRWSQGKLAWDSAEISRAWRTWGEIITISGAVAGGPHGALLTDFEKAGNGMFTDPPRCNFHHAASFITENYRHGDDREDRSAPGRDFDFFRFSPPDDRNRSAQLVGVGGDLLGIVQDTPASRGFVRYLTTPVAQRIWVARGGFISPNSDILPGEYPDSVSQKLAKIVTDATDVAFDASDLMPVTMQTAFYQAILAYVSNPARLPDILQDLEKVRILAY